MFMTNIGISYCSIGISSSLSSKIPSFVKFFGFANLNQFPQSDITHPSIRKSHPCDFYWQWQPSSSSLAELGLTILSFFLSLSELNEGREHFNRIMLIRFRVMMLFFNVNVGCSSPQEWFFTICYSAFVQLCYFTTTFHLIITTPYPLFNYFIWVITVPITSQWGYHSSSILNRRVILRV